MIKRLIFAYKFKRAVSKADRCRRITHRKHMVVSINGNLEVISKQDIKTFIRHRYLRKGTTVADVERLALYSTL